MNLANQFGLTNLEMGLILVGGGVLLSFWFHLSFLRTILRSLRLMQTYLKMMMPSPVVEKHPLWDAGQVRKWIEEAEGICRDLSRNLEEKKEIARDLIEQLDERVHRLGQIEKGMRADASPLPDPKKEEIHEQILTMAQTGNDISEISRRVGLPQDEVRLTLDLQRFRRT